MESTEMELNAEIARSVLIYDAETGALCWRERPGSLFEEEMHCRRWNTKFAGKVAFTSVNHNGYMRGAIFNRCYLAHRVIWLIEKGRWPAGQIDHIDGDRKNNRISNLREVSPSENMRNRKMDSRNTSGATGVFRRGDGKAWVAAVGGAHLGSFANLSDAESVAQEAHRDLGYSSRHGM